MRADTKTLQADGRPSLDTMTAQWEFMRNQFLGSNDEALVREGIIELRLMNVQ